MRFTGLVLFAWDLSSAFADVLSPKLDLESFSTLQTRRGQVVREKLQNDQSEAENADCLESYGCKPTKETLATSATATTTTVPPGPVRLGLLQTVGGQDAAPKRRRKAKKAAAEKAAAEKAAAEKAAAEKAPAEKAATSCFDPCKSSYVESYIHTVTHSMAGHKAATQACQDLVQRLGPCSKWTQPDRAWRCHPNYGAEKNRDKLKSDYIWSEPTQQDRLWDKCIQSGMDDRLSGRHISGQPTLVEAGDKLPFENWNVGNLIRNDDGFLHLVELHCDNMCSQVGQARVEKE